MILSTITCGGIGILIYNYNLQGLKQILYQLQKKHLAFYGLFSIVLGLSFYFLINADLQQNQPNSYLGSLAIIYFLSYTSNIILEAVLIVGKKFRILGIVNFFYAIFFIGIHYGVTAQAFNLNQIINWLSLITSLKFLILLSVAIRSLRNTPVQSAKVMIHLGGVKKLWFSLLLYDTSQIIFRFIDKFIIAFLVAKELAAIYMNGTIDIPFIPVFFASVSSAALLQLTSLEKQKKENVLLIIKHTSQTMATISIAIFTYLFVYREELICWLFSVKYLPAIPIFTIAIFKVLNYLFAVPFFLQFKQRGDLLNKGAFLDMACSLVFVFPLYYFYGLQGMALSFVLSTFVQVFYYTYCAAKLLGTSTLLLLPFRNWAIKLITFFMLSYLLHYICRNSSKYVSIFAGMIAIGIVATIWLWQAYKRQD